MAVYTFVLFFAIAASTQAIRLGDPCSSNTQCSYILNAECRDSTCQCISSRITHENTCVQAVEPATTCNYDSQCKTADPYRMCVNGQCTCVPYYHWDVGCSRNRGLYEYCTSNNDCYWGENMVGLMTCVNSQCSCISGYVPRGKLCVASGSGYGNYYRGY